MYSLQAHRALVTITIWACRDPRASAMYSLNCLCLTCHATGPLCPPITSPHKRPTKLHHPNQATELLDHRFLRAQSKKGGVPRKGGLGRLLSHYFFLVIVWHLPRRHGQSAGSKASGETTCHRSKSQRRRTTSRVNSQGTTLEGSPDSASKIGLGTQALGPGTGIPRELDRFRESDDRWFRT